MDVLPLKLTAQIFFGSLKITFSIYHFDDICPYQSTCLSSYDLVMNSVRTHCADVYVLSI